MGDNKSDKESAIAAHAVSEVDEFGHKQELGKGFSMLSLIGLAFAILNSWVAMATSLTLALPSGGPTAIIYGDILAGLGSLALAASLAEICAVYPTAAGQYYWTAILAPAKYSRGLGYICGWFNVAGWIFLVGSGGSLGGTLVTSIIALLHPNYVLQRWHIFLVYLAYTLFALVLNTFAIRIIPKIDKVAFFWSVGGVVLISIALLASASPNFETGKFVFSQFINTTGWPNGVAWILGLLQPVFGLTAFDACAHMVEEIERPSYYAPRAMVLAVLIGTGSSLVFLIILLFCLNDLDEVLTGSAGPLLTIFFQATGNKAGAVCLLVIPVVCMAFTTQALLTTASRMTWAFARDKGLPFSTILSIVNPHLEVPVYALLFCTGWVIIFGLVFLGSSTALNAIISSSVVALNVSYALPIVVLLIRGRSTLPKGEFALGNFWGPVSNIFGLIFVVVTTIFFIFPPFLPVTPTNMNYTIVVMGIVVILSTGTWVFGGSRDYQGPTSAVVVGGGHANANEKESSAEALKEN